MPGNADLVLENSQLREAAKDLLWALQHRPARERKHYLDEMKMLQRAIDYGSR